MKALMTMFTAIGNGRRGAIHLEAPALKHGGPRISVPPVAEDRLGDEETSMLKKFIMNLINKGFECTTRNIAVLKFMDILSLYEVLRGAESEKERGNKLPDFLTLFGSSNEASCWGGTVLASGNPRLNTDDSLLRVSAVNFDNEVDDKLVYIVSDVIQKYHTNHFFADTKHSNYFFADIKHLVFLQKNYINLSASSLLKTEKINLFLGTVIMKAGEPHVIGAKWNGRFFEVALVCLSTAYVMDEFQFVTIEK